MHSSRFSIRLLKNTKSKNIHHSWRKLPILGASTRTYFQVAVLPRYRQQSKRAAAENRKIAWAHLALLRRHSAINMSGQASMRAKCRWREWLALPLFD